MRSVATECEQYTGFSGCRGRELDEIGNFPGVARPVYNKPQLIVIVEPAAAGGGLYGFKLQPGVPSPAGCTTAKRR